jgi:hypothetical protein
MTSRASRCSTKVGCYLPGQGEEIVPLPLSGSLRLFLGEVRHLLRFYRDHIHRLGYAIERERKRSRLSTAASAAQENLTVDHGDDDAIDSDMIPESTSGAGPSTQSVPDDPVVREPIVSAIPEVPSEELGHTSLSPSEQLKFQTKAQPLIDLDSSDLSDLSDLDDDRRDNPPPSKPTDASSEREITPAVPVEIGKFLPGGTLGAWTLHFKEVYPLTEKENCIAVWAKARTRQYFLYQTLQLTHWYSIIPFLASCRV